MVVNNYSIHLRYARPKKPVRCRSTTGGVYFKYSSMCFFENFTIEYVLKNCVYTGPIRLTIMELRRSRRPAEATLHSPCWASRASMPVLKVCNVQHIKQIKENSKDLR